MTINLNQGRTVTAHTAYCYNTQQWVTGEAALPILRAQLNQELQLLEDPNEGERYFAFIQASDSGLTFREAVANLKNQLADLS